MKSEGNCQIMHDNFEGNNLEERARERWSTQQSSLKGWEQANSIRQTLELFGERLRTGQFNQTNTRTVSKAMLGRGWEQANSIRQTLELFQRQCWGKAENRPIQSDKHWNCFKGNVGERLRTGQFNQTNTQTNTRTVSKAMLGKVLRDRTEHSWAAPSAPMPS